MATATLTQDNSTTTSTGNSTLPITPSNETYRAYVKLDEKGKVDDVRVVTAGKDEATWKELDNPTKPENKDYQLAIQQTFRTYKVGSIEAARNLVDNDEELVNIINAAIAAKTNRKINSYLKELNEDETNLKVDPVEIVDTLDFVQDETRRKNLSPTEKAERMVRTSLKLMFPNLGEDELTAKVSQMIAAMQA
jgi:hypothetical protein